jgi:hypothetical protein
MEEGVGRGRWIGTILSGRRGDGGGVRLIERTLRRELNGTNNNDHEIRRVYNISGIGVRGVWKARYVMEQSSVIGA